jgi:hypothetical protein
MRGFRLPRLPSLRLPLPLGHGLRLHNWGLAEWISLGLFTGVAVAAWRYDAWRHEHGYVDLSMSDICPLVPDPQVLVAENQDKQQESEDDKP